MLHSREPCLFSCIPTAILTSGHVLRQLQICLENQTFSITRAPGVVQGDSLTEVWKGSFC